MLNQKQKLQRSKLTLLFCLSAFTVMTTSCDKQNRPVRPTTKTEQTVLSQDSSNQALQQAAALNANYTVATISLPNKTDKGYTVDVELKNPSGGVLPLTTRHENGQNAIDGTYNDTTRGLQVYIQASCSSDQCSKYLLLATVYKNNQPIYQTLAISYKDDCKFSVVMNSTSFGSFYQNLSAAESASQNVRPVNDGDKCTQN